MSQHNPFKDAETGRLLRNTLLGIVLIALAGISVVVYVLINGGTLADAYAVGNITALLIILLLTIAKMLSRRH